MGWESAYPHCPEDCYWRNNADYDPCRVHDGDAFIRKAHEEDVQRERWVQWSWGSLRLPVFVGRRRARRREWWDLPEREVKFARELERKGTGR